MSGLKVAYKNTYNKETIVYWIHDKSHKNVLTDGYVGITCEFKKRIKKHYSIHSSILKYITQHEIEIDILVICENRYNAEKIENFYRPYANIGWNKAPGGDSIPIFDINTCKKNPNHFFKR